MWCIVIFHSFQIWLIFGWTLWYSPKTAVNLWKNKCSKKILGCYSIELYIWKAILSVGIFNFRMPSAKVRKAYLFFRCHPRKCEWHFQFWDAIRGSAEGIFGFQMPSAEVRKTYLFFGCHLRKRGRHIYFSDIIRGSANDIFNP